MAKGNDLLNRILDEEFLGTLAKSADLYKIGSNSVLDPEEIRIGLKVVPRAVLSMLISELAPMALNASKDINLPFGKNALVRLNKNAADDYTGSVYDNNKLVYSFQNRSIPGLGLILLSTFELYELEELSRPVIVPESDDIEKKVQKLIDERMELHSLVSKVVENKMAEREVIHKLMMNKLGDALSNEAKKNSQIAQIREIHENATPQSDPYFQGMTNGIEVANSIANEKEPNFISAPKTGPINIEAKDVMKKEAPIKKGSPLKEFLARKKKPVEHHVELSKSEVVDCPDCGQCIFNKKYSYSGCICMGSDMESKIWIKKTENGIKMSFSKSWDADNIAALLEVLRKGSQK